MTQPDPQSLADLRQAIDSVDDQVLALLNRRAGLAAEVGRLKSEAAPEALFHAPRREREILARLEAANAGPFPDAAVRTIFQEIMSACLSLEKPLRVAFLGPEGTFTHLAARQQFGGSSQALPQGTIQAVFQAVERDRADYGVVPVENATEGAVDSTLDAFLDSPLRICAEILLPVDQALLVHPGLDLGGVRRVYSHPQALGQCRRWLEAHLPQADRIEAPPPPRRPGSPGRMARGRRWPRSWRRSSSASAWRRRASRISPPMPPASWCWGPRPRSPPAGTAPPCWPWRRMVRAPCCACWNPSPVAA